MTSPSGHSPAAETSSGFRHGRGRDDQSVTGFRQVATCNHRTHHPEQERSVPSASVSSAVASVILHGALSGSDREHETSGIGIGCTDSNARAARSTRAVLVARPDDLQADRQAGAGEAARNRRRRLLREVERDSGTASSRSSASPSSRPRLPCRRRTPRAAASASAADRSSRGTGSSRCRARRASARASSSSSMRDLRALLGHVDAGRGSISAFCCGVKFRSRYAAPENQWRRKIVLGVRRTPGRLLRPARRARRSASPRARTSAATSGSTSA